MIVGGLDVGTTGCKIALYDDKGQNLKTYYKEYNVKRQNGEHEIDFTDVKNGVLELLTSAVKNYKIDALGVTSFGETFAMLDENDNILAPSMLYTDSRGEKQVELLREKLGEEFLTLLTGVKPHPMYSIAKIMWLKDNMPNEFKKAKRILLGEDFIVYSLTGNAYIDYSLAARTAAFDIENKRWSEEIFSAAGIDVNLMSNTVEAGNVAGNIKPEIKKQLGIDYDIVVINGCHDQAAAMIGSGVFENGKAMDGTGTVECIPVVFNSKPSDLNLYEVGYSVVPFISNKYACYALSFTGGATLKWFRDNFAEFENKTCEDNGKNVYAVLDGAVMQGPTGLLILPHFAGAATPYMDNDSKAAILGVTLETTKYDIYKALMEGTSYEILLNFNTLKSFTGEIKEIRATGGGAASDVWLQIKADILNTDIISLDCKEVGAAGTAALCGVAMDMYKDLNSAVSKMAPIKKIFKPNENNKIRYAELYSKYEKLYTSVRGLM